MRIGQVNQDNYMEFSKILGAKTPKALENLWDKEKAIGERSEEEINAMLVRMGYIEEGMLIREGDTSWKKTAPVSDEIKDRLIETVRRQFMTNGNGMSGTRDGDEIGALMKEYRKNISPEERLSVTWTLGEIVHAENSRMIEYVKANIPGWQHGQAIPSDILNAAVSGKSIDIKA